MSFFRRFNLNFFMMLTYAVFCFFLALRVLSYVFFLIERIGQ